MQHSADIGSLRNQIMSTQFPEVVRDRPSLRVQWHLYRAVLVLTDLLVIGAAFRLAHFVRFQTGLKVFDPEVVASIGYYRELALVLMPLWLCVLALNGLYTRSNLLGGTTEYERVFWSTGIGMILVVLFSFLQPDFVLARGWLLLSWLFSFLFATVNRFALRRVVYALRRRGFFLSPTLIVGANDEAKSLAEQLMAWETSGLLLVGFVDDTLKPGSQVGGGRPVLGSKKQLAEIVRDKGITEVVLASSAVSREEMLSIFSVYGFSDDVQLRLSSGLFEIITTGLDVRELANAPLVRVRKERLSSLESTIKALIDYAITLPGLLAISPLLLLIAVAVRLDSPGPVIYRRRVMGRNGRQFDAFKFRTMHVNGDEILARYPELQDELAQEHKLRHDPRITRVGQLLRRASLDELPQLFNVLKRDMSLVGPRMISPAEMEMYGSWGMNLLTVLPGITGLWQVSGRSDVTYTDRVRLDMHYIRNWSIWMDVQIMTRTLPTILKGHGAY